MIIPTSTRYAIAIHVLALLYLNKDERNTSAYLAISACTNPSFIRKILLQLKKSGFISIKKGLGCYELIKKPSAITLLDIYRSVENNARPSMGCGFHKPARACPVTGRVIYSMLEHAFAKAENAMEAALASTTLADIINQR